jgi:vacuolar-type H+-ATPase subunit H
MNEKSVLNEIRELKQKISNAKKVPFSRYVSIDRDEFLSKLEQIEQLLPGEMKKAFFIDKKREEILQKAYRESEEIVSRAEEEKNKLIADSNIIKGAKSEKERILREAREEANNIIKEAEQYAAQVLSRIESVLQKAESAVKEGKENLLYENTDSENKEQRET